MSEKKNIILNGSAKQSAAATRDSCLPIFTEIENVFTTPTTVSEASDDAKELEIEEDLLPYCTNKEKFFLIVYTLKHEKLEILLPFLKLLSLLKGGKGEEYTSSSLPTGSEDAKPSSFTLDLTTPRYSGPRYPRTLPNGEERESIFGRNREFTNSDSSVVTGSKEKKTSSFTFDLSTPRYSEWDFVGSYDGLSMEPGVTERNDEQETILLEDVLNILLGYDGKYIKANILREVNEKRTFRISSHIKPSLHGLVERILPVASDYSSVVRFIDVNTAFSAGKVNQALAASFSAEVIEYMNSVIRLEYIKSVEHLNLHILWCGLQPSMIKLSIMAKIAQYINNENARGADTLNILHRCTSNSLADAEAERICLKLTKAACAPYFQMLEKWLYKGVIDDPFDEFMIIKKNDKGKRYLDWDQKYELRQKCMPFFLKHDDKLILNAGRYMYAIGKSTPEMEEVPCAEMEHIQYDRIDLVYLNMVRRAYDFANETLLSMTGEDQMIRWLNTAKSFFTLEYGDVFYNIIENCSNELDKPTKKIFVPYLQKLVEKSISSASLGQVPFSKEYQVKLEKSALVWQINSLNTTAAIESCEEQSGLDALTFTVSPPWPICILFHSKTLAGYQMLFRHIFHLRYVYMRLTSLRLSDEPKPVYALRYSMTVFVQTCLSYMTTDTVQTLWERFENEFRSVVSVIELIQLHNSYMYQALMGCMLASADIFQQLRKTLTICLDFCIQKTIDTEMEFRKNLVILIKAASRETCWYSFIKSLIPTFTNIPEVVELNNLCLY